MHFQRDLAQLILTNDPQVPVLRERAINGNSLILGNFCTALNRLLLQQKNHEYAYKQVNQFFMSANAQAITRINRQVLYTLVLKHTRDELDEFLIFWNRASRQLQKLIEYQQYQQLRKTFQTIKIRNQNRQLSMPFKAFGQKLQQNIRKFDNNKVEFFQSFYSQSLAESSILDENYQQIIQFNNIQINQIRNRLQNQQIDQLSKKQFLIKAMNFLNYKPRTKNQRLKKQYDQNQRWAIEFINREKNGSTQKTLTTKKQKEQLNQNPKKLSIYKKNNQIIQKVDNKVNSYQQKQDLQVEDCIILSDHQQIKINNTDFSNKRANSKRFQFIKEKDSQIKNLSFRKDNPKDLNTSKPKQEQIVYQFRPKFIQNTSQINNIPKLERNIFEQHNKKNIIQIEYSPKQADLVILKHGLKQQNNRNFKQNRMKQQNKRQIKQFETPYNNLKHNIDTGTVVQRKTERFDYSHSPSTAFQLRTAKQGSTFKKFSQFNEEKKQRKMGISNQVIAHIEDYIFNPYLQNFQSKTSFNKFRRNCLQEYFNLFNSQDIQINCFVESITMNKIKLQVDFQNKSNSNLQVEAIYRIPKSMKVQNYSKVKKRWCLVGSNKHVFGLQIISFPLQPCLFQLKYSSELLMTKSYIVPIPITVLNFLQYLILNQQQWIHKWKEWSQAQNCKLVKNIFLQNGVINQNQLISTFKQYTSISPIQGYSIKQLGGYCTQKNFDDLTFLIRISQRIGNIITIQLLTNRRVSTKDEIDFLTYCMNIWSMLIGKVQPSSMA